MGARQSHAPSTEGAIVWCLTKHDLGCLVLALVECDLHFVGQVGLVVGFYANLVDHGLFKTSNHMCSCLLVSLCLFFPHEIQRFLMYRGILVVRFKYLVRFRYGRFRILDCLL